MNSGPALHKRQGYDSAVHGREDDHLNRWPFAKEIYGVATTGPREWSVRIGVYGEWGTGKTSVLNFVDTLAREAGHIVVRFNPWEYATRDVMWRSFVVAVYREVESTLGGVKGGTTAEAKAWAQKLAGWSSKLLGGVASVWSDKAGEAVEHGLELLKRGLSFGKGDLAGIEDVLGDKRILVLIDDLDRTHCELVPEMLFAIKEIMDVGGFAFVCAFDPVVVGQVLGECHKGIGDGQHFLEKIIDYPRWVPQPSRNGLLVLGRRDVEKYCPYVPPDVLGQVIGLLPQNPRALRQCIRLLALLKQEIERHDPGELNWPVILVANVIKIRFPRSAPLLLEDKDFWHEVHGVNLLERSDPAVKLDALVEKQLGKVDDQKTLSTDDRCLVKNLLLELSRRLDAWLGVDEEKMLYQLRVAEAPAAVTWKEFDAFLAETGAAPLRDVVDDWIGKHAHVVGCDYQSVYNELFDKLLGARQAELSREGNAVSVGDATPIMERALTLMSLLECLTFELGLLRDRASRLDVPRFEKALDSMTSHFEWAPTPQLKTLRERERGYLRRWAEEWGGDLGPVLRLLAPFTPGFDPPSVKAFREELSRLLAPKYAEQVIDRLRDPEFVENVIRDGAHMARRFIFDVDGPLWAGSRDKVLTVLKEAGVNACVQGNAYEMLTTFGNLLVREKGFDEAQQAELILRDDQLREAIWAAATACQLSPRATVRLREAYDCMSSLGGHVELPGWWEPTLASFGPAIQRASPREPDAQMGK